MKAAVLIGVRQVEIRDVPEPKPPAAHEVLLQVDTVGVCGSDMHYYRSGRIGREQVVEFPWIVGHECAGVVLETGAGVTTVSPGDRVAIDPLIYCDRCEQCKAGRRHTCLHQAFLGVPGQIPGSLAEKIVMPAYCCYPIPDAMTMDQAVMTEPFAIGLYAQRRPGPPDGKQIAVLGSGPIGLCVLLALKAAGPCKVFCTDLLDDRMQMAGRCGADWTGNPQRGNVVAAIGAQCPDGLDVVFECAGKPETLDQATGLLKPGGTLVIVGIPEADRIGFDMNHLRRKELTLLNIRRQNECVQPAIDMVAARQVDLDTLVTHHFDLSGTREAFDMVADYQKGAVKAMIRIASS